MTKPLPPITILITTFYPTGAEARFDTMKVAVESWGELMCYEEEAFHIVVEDDGSDPRFDIQLNTIPMLFESSTHAVLTTTLDTAATEFRKAPVLSGVAGVGASLNRGIAVATSDLILYAVDDWIIKEPHIFDLTPWARILAEDDTVGCVRFFPHPHLQGGQILNYEHAWAIEFDRLGYYWAQRPALYHRRFFDAYGKFPEGVSALEVDRYYNEQICAADIGPRVIHALPQAWGHLEDNTVELGDLVPGTPVPAERLR